MEFFTEFSTEFHTESFTELLTELVIEPLAKVVSENRIEAPVFLPNLSMLIYP